MTTRTKAATGAARTAPGTSAAAARHMLAGIPVRASVAVVALLAAVVLAAQGAHPAVVAGLAALAIWMQQSLRTNSRDARHLAAVIHDIDEPVLIADPTTLEISYANARATDGTGFTPETAAGRHLWEMSRGLDSARLLRIAATLRVDGPGADMDHHSRVGADEFFWRLHLRLVASRHGPQLAVVAHDVTAQRVAEKDLREREAEYRHLAEESSGVVYRATVAPDTHLEYVGPRLRDVLGDDPAEVLADPSVVLDRIHPADGHPFDDVDRRWPGVHTYRVRHIDGRWVTIEDRHRPVVDADGVPIASHGVLFDVTERAAAEAARTRALAHERELSRQLEQTAQVQRAFLQSVSHEIRTPLTVVRGLAHTLDRHFDRLTPEMAQDLVRRLQTNTDRLDGLLADLLDLERLQAHGGSQRRIEVADLCRGLVADLPAPEHTVELDLAPAVALADEGQLRRVVLALLENALRHTPAGTTVTVRTRAYEHAVAIKVLDDGPGVDAAVRPRMFEPFTQGTAAANDPSPGTGIGLALARTLVRSQGGTLTHRDGSPTGSWFVIHLPAGSAEALQGAATEDAAATPATTSAAPLHVH